MISLIFLIIIIKPVIGDQCAIYDFNPKGETTAFCYNAVTTTYVRPYLIYNDVNLLTKYIPHVALEIQTCYDSYCMHDTYGKADNSKVYSPDILTSGMMCNNINETCTYVNPGYNKKNITDWIPINSNNKEKIKSYIKMEQIYPTTYSLFFNNCASFIAKTLNIIGINFSCRFGFFDFPLWCSYRT